MSWWVLAVSLLVSLAINYFLRPKPTTKNATNPNHRKFTFTTNSSGRVVPVVFGTARLEGNIIWVGNPASNEVYKTDITRTEISMGKTRTVKVGEALIASFAIAYCEPVDDITEFWRDNTKVSDIRTDGATNKTVHVRTGSHSDIGYKSSYFTQPVRLYNGHNTPDPFIQERTGYSIAYKNLCYIVGEKIWVGDNTTKLPQYSLTVRRCKLIPDGFLGYNWSDYAELGKSGSMFIYSADANPAHVILYFLREFLNIPDSMIDFQSFYDAGKTLYEEVVSTTVDYSNGLGVSFVLEDREEVEKWIGEILRVIDGILFFDYETGKITLRLIRADYNPNTLPVITDDDLESLEFERRGIEDLVSEVTVRYTSRTTWEPTTLTIHNPAAEQMIGYRKNATYDYMLITSPFAAEKVAKRLLLKESYPYALVKFTTSLSIHKLKPGDVIKLNSEKLGIEIILRVMAVNGDPYNTDKIEVECVEDIFGVGELELSVTDESFSDDYTWEIQPVQSARVWDAAQEMATDSSIVLAVEKPAGYVQGIDLYINNTYKGSFSPDIYGKAILQSPYPKGEFKRSVHEIDDTTGIIITPITHIRPVTATRAKLQRLGFVAIIGNDQNGWEVIAFQNLEDNGDGTFTIKNIIRGLMNSPILDHSPGEEVWIFYTSAHDIPVYSIGYTSSVNVELVAYNAKQTTAPYSVSHTYGFTVQKPYPPANIKAIRNGNNVEISWVPCKRLSGANYRNIDAIPAGDGEGTWEGTWWVSWDNWNSYIEVSPTSLTNGRVVFTRADSTQRTYRIKTVLNGISSEEVTVTI